MVPANPSRGQLLLVAAILVVALLLGVRWLAPLPLGGDFMGYWSGAALLAQGQSPYDGEALRAMQQATGRGLPFTIYLWNPPWAFVLLLPLGLIPFAEARALWLLLSLMAFMGVGHALAQRYWPAAPRGALLLAPLLPLLAFPVWLALIQGQINVLVLAGVVGTLFFWGRSDPAVALCFLLASIKPQLSLGALALVALRLLVERRGRLLAWLVAEGALLLLLLFWLEPRWMQEYQWVLHSPLGDFRTPTLATWAREQWPVLPVTYIAWGGALLSLLLAAAWTVRTRRWDDGMAAAVLITLLFTLFSWSYDRIMLLIPGYALIGRLRRSRALLVALGGALLALNVAVLMVKRRSSDDFDFFWVPSAMAVLAVAALLLSRRGTRSERQVAA